MPKRKSVPRIRPRGDAEPAQTAAIKNWGTIKGITFSCPHKIIVVGRFGIAALQDDCVVTITHNDGSSQQHTVKRGGGIEKFDDIIVVWRDPVFRLD